MVIQSVIDKYTDPTFRLNCKSLYYYTTLDTFIGKIVNDENSFDGLVMWIIG